MSGIKIRINGCMHESGSEVYIKIKDPWWTKCSNCGNPGWILMNDVTAEIRKHLIKENKGQALYWLAANKHICEECYMKELNIRE